MLLNKVDELAKKAPRKSKTDKYIEKKALTKGKKCGRWREVAVSLKMLTVLNKKIASLQFKNIQEVLRDLIQSLYELFFVVCVVSLRLSVKKRQSWNMGEMGWGCQYRVGSLCVCICTLFLLFAALCTFIIIFYIESESNTQCEIANSTKHTTKQILVAARNLPIRSIAIINSFFLSPFFSVLRSPGEWTKTIEEEGFAIYIISMGCMCHTFGVNSFTRRTHIVTLTFFSAAYNNFVVLIVRSACFRADHIHNSFFFSLLQHLHDDEQLVISLNMIRFQNRRIQRERENSASFDFTKLTGWTENERRQREKREIASKGTRAERHTHKTKCKVHKIEKKTFSNVHKI